LAHEISDHLGIMQVSNIGALLMESLHGNGLSFTANKLKMFKEKLAKTN